MSFVHLLIGINTPSVPTFLALFIILIDGPNLNKKRVITVGTKGVTFDKAK